MNGLTSKHFKAFSIWQKVPLTKISVFRLIDSAENEPTRLRFILPILSQVIITLGSFAVIILLPFMVHKFLWHEINLVEEIKR